jgi:hypothetical protein
LPRKLESKARGGTAAGVGSGVGLTLIAQSLPANWKWVTPWLTYAAPIVSVSAAIYWSWATTRVNAHFARRALNKNLTAMRKLNKEIQMNDKASKNHKESSQRRVEALESLAMELEHASAEEVMEILRPDDEVTRPKAAPAAPAGAKATRQGTEMDHDPLATEMEPITEGGEETASGMGDVGYEPHAAIISETEVTPTVPETPPNPARETQRRSDRTSRK